MTNLLVVDIGNTTTKVGVWNGTTIEAVSIAPTANTTNLESRVSNLDAVAICSVVPQAEARWLELCQREGHDVFVLRGDTPAPLTNRYREPARLGPDRLATAVGAAHRFGVPVIVVSLGTAVVIDAVSASKEYLGGAIWVGITPGLDVLFERATMIPRISGRPPSTPIGANTEECLLAGAFHGTAALIEGIVARMREHVGKETPLILTGGDAELVSFYLAMPHEVVPYLTMIGTALIWEHCRSLNAPPRARGGGGGGIQADANR